MRALASRDLRRLEQESGLPLVVRYPKRYAHGRIVEYAIDSEAIDPAERGRLLDRLLAVFPRRPGRDALDEEEPVLLPGAHADVAQGPGRSVWVRFCPARFHGDGTYDHIKLTLRHDRDLWRVQAVEVGWFLYD